MSVQIVQKLATLFVSSPYSDRFVAGAKKLGGRWDPEGRTWEFPLAKQAHLRALLIEVYKCDGGLPEGKPPEEPRGNLLPAVEEINELLAQLGARLGTAAEA